MKGLKINVLVVSQDQDLIGSLSGGLAVALGAFGAHALRNRITTERLETFETGVRYHFYHALAMLAAALGAARWPGSGLPEAAGWFFLAGTLLFSGAGLQQAGLATTTIGNASFITGLYVVLVPLILGTFRDSQTLEIAMSSRAFGAPIKRTFLLESQMGPADYIVLVIAILLMAGGIFLRIQGFGVS